VVSNGTVVEALVDTTGNGVADTREVYQGGEILRVEIDTNNDRAPDIVQTTLPGGVSRQDEDADFNGTIDRRFDGDALIESATGTKIEGSRFGTLDCGGFDSFWTKR
jgi:hypothetical protein